MFYVIIMINEILDKLEGRISEMGFSKRFSPENLFLPIDYTLDKSGKRIRPLFCILSHHLFSDCMEDVISQAVALEIFHNFTLIHDDLMDKSPIRRNKETVYKKWNDNIAILSGDAMSILSYHYLSQNTDEKKLPELLRVFNSVALDVCIGQQYDMDFESLDEVGEDDYLNMIRLKTAVLIGGSMQIGAIQAGADTNICKKLYDIGVNIGLAFQMQDDILDVYSDENTFGKPIGNDICNSKKTFLLIYTRNNLSLEDNIYLSNLLSLPKDENKRKIKEVTRLYNKVSARENIESRATAYIEKAFSMLEEIPVDSRRKEPLKELINKLVSRKK